MWHVELGGRDSCPSYWIVSELSNLFIIAIISSSLTHCTLEVNMKRATLLDDITHPDYFWKNMLEKLPVSFLNKFHITWCKELKVFFQSVWLCSKTLVWFWFYYMYLYFLHVLDIKTAKRSAKYFCWHFVYEQCAWWYHHKTQHLIAVVGTETHGNFCKLYDHS